MAFKVILGKKLFQADSKLAELATLAEVIRPFQARLAARGNYSTAKYFFLEKI